MNDMVSIQYFNLCHGDIAWSKGESQEIPEVTGKFGLGGQNEAGQRRTELCQENSLVIANTLFQQHETTLHMDITRWTIPKSVWLVFADEDGEALYSQQKQDWELTVDQIMIPYWQIQT